MGRDHELLISADAHVEESEAMFERLPEHLRPQLARWERIGEGLVHLEVGGFVAAFDSKGRKPTERELACEFRRDPSGGTDLARRLADMQREAVHGHVIFPNTNLCFEGGRNSTEYYVTFSRTYNDWVWEVFAPEGRRFRPAALLQLDDLDAAVAEAERCIRKGFKTLFLPASVPWRPYYHPAYERLWSLAEDAGIPLNFHVFSGNLWFGSDFAFLPHLPEERLALAHRLARESGPETPERLSTTVIGMAAGMAPIVHLTGAGVLERHPDLRFVVTESECGWLAWTLHAMDAMQDRRRLSLDQLPLKPSEYFRRQGYVTITDDPVALHNVELTGSRCLLWGNDYPHDEGTFPNSPRYVEEIRRAVPPEAAHDILCGNAARLFDFDLDRLAFSEGQASARPC